MAKTSDKKITKEGQNSNRPPAKRYFKKLTNNLSRDVSLSHRPSVPYPNSSENRALAPITDNNSSSSKFKDEFSGYIFMCSGKTKQQCYINRVFGLPSGRREVVEKIKPGTKLFLFDTDVKLLYGVYEATSNGGMNLEPSAFDGNFPAQVKFKIYKDAIPLFVNSFRHAIKDNYQGSKFAPELTSQQVRALLSLFRPIGERSSGPRFSTAPNRAPQLRMRHPGLNRAPESRRIAATNNGRVNGSLITSLQNQFRPFQNIPQQNMVNPHLRNCHQAPPPPPPPRHQYSRYMPMNDMHLHGQTIEPVFNHVDGYLGPNSYPMPQAGFGCPHMRPTALTVDQRLDKRRLIGDYGR